MYIHVGKFNDVNFKYNKCLNSKIGFVLHLDSVGIILNLSMCKKLCNSILHTGYAIYILFNLSLI